MTVRIDKRILMRKWKCLEVREDFQNTRAWTTPLGLGKSCPKPQGMSEVLVATPCHPQGRGHLTSATNWVSSASTRGASTRPQPASTFSGFLMSE